MTHYQFAVEMAFTAFGSDPCNARFARIVQRLASLLPEPARLLKVAETPEENLFEVGTRMLATNPAQALHMVLLTIELALRETPGFQNEIGEMRVATVREFTIPVKEKIAKQLGNIDDIDIEIALD